MTNSVLVLGGAGYIGSHVCYALAQHGYEPICYDNYSTGHEWAVKWGPFVQADTTNAEQLGDALRRYSPVACVHLAASIEVGESCIDPLKYYANNTGGTIKVMQVLKTSSSMKAMVFSSTAAVYGEPRQVPVPESHVLMPTNPYGWSKLFCEQLLRDQALAAGLPTVCLRYFNAAGALVEQGIGEDHSPETHLVPNACLASLGRVPQLKIFGDDYDTPDGTAIRDYIHVQDLAEAHVLAMEYLLAGGETTSLNLGNGDGYSVRQVIEAVDAVADTPVPYQMAPRRDGDVARLIADALLSKKVLGWVPKHKSIEAIVSSAYAWHRRHHAGIA